MSWGHTCINDNLKFVIVIIRLKEINPNSVHHYILALTVHAAAQKYCTAYIFIPIIYCMNVFFVS